MLLYQDKSTTPETARDLADDIEAGIAAGLLVPGDRLPSVRTLASDVDLAPNTVASAYRRLAHRGVLVSRGREGTFVAIRPPITSIAAAPVPEGAVDLASGGPDPALLPDLGPHLAHSGPSSSYTDPVILPELVAAAEGWLRSQGLVPGPITLASGALDAVERVLLAHLRPGDAVALERPGWSAMFDLVRALGLRSVPVDTDDSGMLPVALGDVLRSVQAVVVTPRAQNPTGAAVDEERSRRLAAVLAEHPGVLVVEDDHAGPVAGAELHPVGPGRRRWAFVQSVAKALGPDLRLAMVTGDDVTVRRVAGRHGIGPGWVSRLLQSAVASMFTDRGVHELLGRAERSYASRRGEMIDALRDAGIDGATGRSGLNVWVPVTSEQVAVASAADAGFMVRAGQDFGARVPSVRITIAGLGPGHSSPLAAGLARSGRGPGRVV